MHKVWLISLFSAASLCAVVPKQCKSQIICIRGSLEEPGCGKQVGPVAEQLQKRLGDADITPLVYPAVFNGLGNNAEPDVASYMASVRKGVDALESLLQSFKNECSTPPNVSILGYSQGANVVGDYIAGGIANEPAGSLASTFKEDSCKFFFIPTQQRIHFSNKHIAVVKGVVMFGEPRHFRGDNNDWERGTSSEGPDNGSFIDRPQEQRGLIEAVGDAGKLLTYCDAKDRYCASGRGGEKPYEVSAHHGYAGNYTSDAVDFLVQKNGRSYY